MRNDRRQDRTAELASVQGYHETDYSTNTTRESYAFQGFKKLYCLTSDRSIPLVMQDGHSVRADGKSLKAYGIELENECTGIKNNRVYAEVFDKIIAASFPDGFWKMQHDGSLGTSDAIGVECITQTATKEGFRNQYSNFKLMFNTYFPAFGISASRSGQCGMHVNISVGNFGEKPENVEEAVKKLLYFVNHHYDFCCALFYRNPDNTFYCGRMREYSTQDGAKAADVHNMDGSHYNSMNYSHFDAGRIEIRLVGGQKDFACFRNTMEAVFHLVEAVKRLKWNQLDNLAKVFEGCNQYVFDRIRSYCYERGTICAADVEAIRGTVKRAEYI